MAYDETVASRLRGLLAARGDVTEKKLMGGLCFMVNGNMCINASRHGGVLVRVGPDVFQALAKEPHARTVKMGGGRMMTGFVYVDPPGIASDAQLKAWVGRALVFVATLPGSASKSKGMAKPKAKSSGPRKNPARRRRG